MNRADARHPNVFRSPAAALALVLALGVAAIPAFAQDTERVHVSGGAIAGTTIGDVSTFLGIPYAAAPVGSRRWRAPEPVVPWDGVRQATDYGASCPQSSEPRFVLPASRGATRSEDCLFLNVWTPAVRTKPLPVMVWLHGGGNTSGSAAQVFYDGTSFAHDGVVLVSLNYRLGLLGFFAHRALSDGASGEDAVNFGLLDQLAALRWVKANIATFGGDPANVTLFGESAGALDAALLAGAPDADGLFTRAILESAGGLWDTWQTLPQARDLGAKVATKLGLPGDRATSAQLRAIPADRLAALGDDDQIGVSVDGRLITGESPVLFAHGTRVPLIVGTDAGDGSLLGNVAPQNVFPPLSPAHLAFVRAQYEAAGITGDEQQAQRLFGDGYFAGPARWLAMRTAAAGKPAYLFRFEYILRALAGARTTATHGSEIPFVFESLRATLAPGADHDVALAIHDCWVAFAKTGAPACAGAAWPAYTSASAQEMIFGKRAIVRPVDDAGVLDVLQGDLAPH